MAEDLALVQRLMRELRRATARITFSLILRMCSRDRDKDKHRHYEPRLEDG
jgi:hypothetical protein